MKTSIILKGKQGEELLRVKKRSKSSAVRDRAHAILLRSKGKKVREIAEVVFRSETFVKASIKKYLDKGIRSVTVHRKGGNSRKLSHEEKRELKGLLEKNPKEYGFKENFWSIELLKIFVERRYKVNYKSNQSYYDLFRYCGYSFQKPGKKDIRHDPVKVEEFEDGVKKTYESTKVRLSW